MTKKREFDYIIIGTGPAGLGAAFELKSLRPKAEILMLDREKFSTGA
jgi:protoporphyrinogen oxidase